MFDVWIGLRMVRQEARAGHAPGSHSSVETNCAPCAGHSCGISSIVRNPAAAPAHCNVCTPPRTSPMFTMLGRSCWPSLARASLILVAAFAAAFPKHGFAASSDRNQTVRKYSISADKVWWDYAPLGLDGCSGQSWDEGAAVFTVAGIGSKYLKSIFREYDSNFTVSQSSSRYIIRTGGLQDVTSNRSPGALVGET
jgi:hypothetical protein